MSLSNLSAGEHLLKWLFVITLITLLLVSSSGVIQPVQSSCNSADISHCLPLIEDEPQEECSVRYQYDHLLPTRDVSVREIEADRIWDMLDDSGLNLTGEGIIVADLDTGVDWKHPDLWFADGESYEWIDGNTNGYVDSGDGIDLDRSGDLQPDEYLGIVDTQGDASYSAELDWIWAESIIDDGIPQVGERFFVANDTNNNDILDVEEELIMLNTPKIKYIVEGDGSEPMDYITWERGVNLTMSTHSDSYGHGTAVAGILCGGHPEFRRFTGVAPSAELIMIKIIDGGQTNTGIPLYDAINKAAELGADVILVEAGQWVEVFMDGSSKVEQLINDLSNSGIPVIVPSGNLGGAERHAMFNVVKNIPYTVDYHVPLAGTERVWLTALTVNATDMTLGDFTVSIPTGGSPTHNDVVLNPGYGYRNYGYDSDPGTGAQFASYVDVSSRGTKMLFIEMYKEGGLPLDSPYQLTIGVENNCTFHTYIQDSMSGWSGGSVFQTDVSNNYIIAFPATSDSAVSVASYHTRSYYGTIGAIADYSAHGPRIDGVMQQGVAAPGGYDIISDYTNQSAWTSWYAGPGGVLGFVETFGGHRLFSGTSAAGPHVAGCAALMLQSNTYANRSAGKIIKNTAWQDGFTGSTPNHIWGYGKLNVSAAVIDAMAVEPPMIHSVWRNIEPVEYEDIVTIIANVTEGSNPIDVFLRFGVDNSDRPEYRRMAMDMNGNYSYSIGSFTYSSVIYYNIYVNDTAGSFVESTADSFFIYDFTSPNLSGRTATPQPAGIEATVHLTIEVSEPVDASGIAGVYFNYTTDAWASHATVEMTDSGSYYSGEIPGQLYGVTVGYVFYAVDVAGNLGNTSTLYYSIIDDQAPVIGTPVHSPNNPNSTQTVVVSVSVTDESRVSSVVLEYFNGSHWNNASMAFNGTLYVADIPPLANDTQVLYKVHAYDENGNGASSSQYNYTIYNEPVVTTTTIPTTTTSPMTGTTIEPPDPFLMYLALGASVSLTIVLLILIVYKRRK